LTPRALPGGSRSPRCLGDDCLLLIQDLKNARFIDSSLPPKPPVVRCRGLGEFEAYLRMESMDPIQWQGRAHLLAVASNITRHALIDGARRRRASKRDGGSQVTLSDENLGGLEAGHDALDVDELLTELESINAVGLPVHSLQKVPF
jgi:hypothetical protein